MIFRENEWAKRTDNSLKMIVFGSMNGPRRQTIVCDKVYPCMIAILNLPSCNTSFK